MATPNDVLAQFEPRVWLYTPSRQWDSEITIEAVRSADGPDQYAIRRAGRCLNKKGEWEYEPLPSNRSAAFLKRCRYATLGKAIDHYVKYEADASNAKLPAGVGKIQA